MLLDSLINSLNQIIDILKRIQNLPSKQQNTLYIQSNIGKHIRHVADHFLAVKNKNSENIINYNQRNRGINTETNSDEGILQLQQLIDWLTHCKISINDKQMNDNIRVYSEIDALKTSHMEFTSTLKREFLYLINHTIHHAAHIGLICKHNGIDVPTNTGMAPCTLSFLRQEKS